MHKASFDILASQLILEKKDRFTAPIWYSDKLRVQRDIGNKVVADVKWGDKGVSGGPYFGTRKMETFQRNFWAFECWRKQ